MAATALLHSGSEARRLPRRTAAPIRVALVALIIAMGFVGVRLATHDGHPGAFIRLGHRTVTEELPGELRSQVDTTGSGYDGQYYYRLARAPFSTQENVDGVPFDRPAYRNARFGYPLLAWIVSAGGQEALVPWALIVVNLAAIAAVAGLTAALARDSGFSGWYGLAAAAWPGLTVALAFDLAEPVEAAFLLAAVLALRRRRLVIAAGTLSLAVLARETALLFAGAVFLVSAIELVRSRRWALIDGPLAFRRCVVAVVPMLAYGSNQILMSRLWADAEAGAAESAEFLTIPGSELFRQLVTFVQSGGAVDLYQLIQLVLIGLVVAIILRTLIERGPNHWERLATAVGLVALISLPTWDRMVVFLRYPDDFVHVGLVMAFTVPVARLPPWARPQMLAKCIALLWLSTAVIWAPAL